MNTSMLRADLDLIHGLEQELEALRTQYAARPQLFEVYSQSLLYRLQLLQTRVREHVAAGDEAADFWIRLRGPSIGTGTGSLEAITAFMERFRIAAKHAVSAILGGSYAGGRFTGEVESATSFQLVATAPGSFQIGLTGPPPIPAAATGAELFERDVVREAIREADTANALGIRGITTILLALQAPDDKDALRRLRADLDDHGTLRVLFHARSLFPRGIDDIEFRGRMVGTPRRFDSATRERLREIGDQLVQAERYVEGVGILQMLDLSARTLRFDFARLGGFETMQRVQADYREELDERVRESAGRPVAFTGTLRFDQKGVPQRVVVDSLVGIEAGTTETSQVSAF